MSERRSAFDLVECFHLTHAVAALKDRGVLDAMQERVSVEQLARQFGFEAVMLGRVLQFVARRTNLLEYRDDSVCLSEHFDTQGSSLARYTACALDNAFYDLQGKATGHPVYELLGGAVRREAIARSIEWLA